MITIKRWLNFWFVFLFLMRFNYESCWNSRSQSILLCSTLLWFLPFSVRVRARLPLPLQETRWGKIHILYSTWRPQRPSGAVARIVIFAATLQQWHMTKAKTMHLSVFFFFCDFFCFRFFSVSSGIYG